MKENQVRSPYMFKKSLLAMCVAVIGVPVSVSAQEKTETDVEEIVVKGVRAALESAQDIKRKSDTFVDAISATDIGALPDKSVLESLQRVPGVSVERYSAATDPDHFSIEGSGITLRGLPQTRSEFNGRDSFSANSGRGLSFQDVPPELMSKVEVYKNQTADLIEGGISGSINLNTRKPFDAAGRQLAFNAAANYADLSGETKPSFSGLYSDRWQTDIGEFGVLVSVATNKLTSRTDGVAYGQVANNANHDGDVPDSEKLQSTPVVIDGQQQSRYLPINMAVRSATQERTRDGGSFVLQWANPEDTLKGTFEYMRSKSNRNFMEHNVEADDKTAPLSNAVYNNSYVVAGEFAGVDSYTATTRFQNHTSLVEDFSVNFVYTPSDELTLKLDAQHIKAKTDETDLSIQAGVMAATTFDFRGSRPVVKMTAPASANASDHDYFTNPSNYFWRSAMDHLEDSSGDENAVRLDAKYEINQGWAKSVETGVRFSDRQQNTQWSNYNWGKLSEAWDGTGRKYFDGVVDTTPWDGVHNGPQYSHNGPFETLGGRGDLFRSSRVGVAGGEILVPAESIVRNYQDFVSTTSAFGYKPAIARDGLVKGAYKLNELNDIEEKNHSIYFKLNYGSEDEVISGNIGLRYVTDDTDSTGGTSYANTFDTQLKAQLLDFYTGKNDLKTYNDLVAWHSGTSDPKQTASNKFSKLLPSFNVKYAIADDVVGRFAISQAVAYADMGNLRNYRGMYSIPTFTRENNSPNGKITDITWDYKGGSGNPYLKPMESINYDASIEWYFGKSSSVFAGIFKKDMKNFFANGTVDTAIENNGVTRVVSLSMPVNIGTSQITGFEMGYQQFYDMLPAPFDGLGMQANFTLIDQSGDVPNSGLDSSTPPDGQGGGNVIKPTFNKLPLQGMSDVTYNIVGMYEKGDVSARLAWNWRSEYLLTARDVITKAPIYAQPSGQLDASIFYTLFDHYKIGLEGANLLDELTWTKMQVDEKGTKVPRNYFINDRRISLVFKGQF